MTANEIAQLLGKALLLYSANRSIPVTRSLLAMAGYTDEEITSTIDYLRTEARLPQ